MKKIPLRMCTVTREKLEKKDLIRIVRTKENEIKIDLTGKLNGHGAYIKKDLEVIDTARKKKTLNHALECEVPDEIFEELKKLV